MKIIKYNHEYLSSVPNLVSRHSLEQCPGHQYAPEEMKNIVDIEPST